MTRFFLLATIVAIYFLGAIIMHHFLWNVMLAQDSFPKRDGKKSEEDFNIEFHGWVLALNLMSMAWPMSIALGIVTTILGLIKSVISPK